MATGGSDDVEADDSENKLTCAICLEKYRRPKLLPCYHSFCQSCLQGVAGSSPTLSCPSCRMFVMLPPGGVRELQRMAKWKVASHLALAIKEAEKQAELKRLQEEQYQESTRNGNILRKLAREKGRITCHAKAPFIRDDRMMEILGAETENSEWDAHVAGSDYFRRQDEHNLGVLQQNLQVKDATVDEGKSVRDKIHETRMREKEVDKEIKDTQLKLKALNNELSKVNSVHPDKVMRRQEVAHQNYGRQQECNRQLREQIDHLEMERDKLKCILEALENDCELLSKELHVLSERCKTTYENRDHIITNMGKLQDHLDKNTAAYESDMRSLQFNIDVLRRTERFITTKNKYRADEGRERRRDHQNQVSVTKKDSMIFGSLLERIRTELNQTDVQQIIRTFVQLQEENYMLFKNISETREACDQMMTEIEDIQSKIATLCNDQQQTEREAFARKLELMDKAEMCQKEADKKEEYIEKADQVIDNYIRGILAMLKRLGYTDHHILQLSGVFKCVEERNISDFLAELERYVNKVYDLKTMADFLAYDRARKSDMMPPPPEPLPPRLALQHRVVVVPPVHEEGDDVDDPALPTEAAFRPLSVAEIVHHVEEDLENRERREELGGPIPAPTMNDLTSEIIGDTPQTAVTTRVVASDVF